MSFNRQFRALVVDDEPLVRQATMRSLSRVDFVCDAAQDGAVAGEMAEQQRYDLVVTDLRMPEMNGHQLAVSLLASANRPVVVILTGVAEPKIAADLKARGVDEIFFKPIEYDDLARRALALVRERPDRRRLAGDASVDKSAEVNAKPEKSCESEAASATIAVLASQVAHAAGELRKPPADFDAFARASRNGFNATVLAKAVESNPSFAVDVLRLTNSMLYSSNKSAAELKNSIAAIERSATVRSVMIFAGGAVLGWLLSWFGAAAWRW